MREEIICAGFGGQGVILLGKVIAQAALDEGKHLIWIPSYGAAMRGGTAFCMVIVSDKPIASPYIEKCDTLFAFNQPSWSKFNSYLKKDSLVFLNSSLITNKLTLGKVRLLQLPFTQIATSLGELRVTNMIALGAFLKVKKILKLQTVLRVFSEIAPKNKQHLVTINKKALQKGYSLV